ncbi:MAG: DedA family protein [Pseudomonadota bacterium]
MEQLASRIIEFVSQQNNPLGLAVIALSALLEYVFPPFPGDSVTLFGAFLITARGWSFPLVFGAVIAGSLAGVALDFSVGRWLKRREETHVSRHPRIRQKVDKLVERFRRHGEALIVLNRFLPGIRALFFVAAGMAGMRRGWVLFWAMVSAVLWNLMLIAAGSAVGANFDELKALLAGYSRLVWMALGVLAVALLVRYLYHQIRRDKG